GGVAGTAGAAPCAPAAAGSFFAFAALAPAAFVPWALLPVTAVTVVFVPCGAPALFVAAAWFCCTNPADCCCTAAEGSVFGAAPVGITPAEEAPTPAIALLLHRLAAIRRKRNGTANMGKPVAGIGSYLSASCAAGYNDSCSNANVPC